MTHGAVVTRWLRATLLGWLLGLPLIILMALAGEAIGLGGSQVLVGAGMGAGVGFMQGRALRRTLGTAVPWFWSTTVGLAMPFLAVDLAALTGRALPYSLYVAIGCAGLIAGGWQAILLRPHLAWSGWWIPASVLGWTAAAGTTALADSLTRSHAIRGLPGAALYLALVALGGLVLGGISGPTLAWLHRRTGSIREEGAWTKISNS